MQVLISLSLLLNLIGTIQASVLAVLLIVRGKRNRLNFIIGSLLIVLAIIIFNTFLILSHRAHQYPFYQDLSNAFSLLIGPLLFMLVKSYLNDRIWRTHILIHLMPFFLYLPLSIIFGLADGNFQINFSWLQIVQEITMPWLWNLQMAIYLSLSTYLILNNTNRRNRNTRWIRNLVLYIAAIWTINFSLQVISRFVYPIPELVLLNITLLLAFLIISIAFKIFNDPINQSATFGSFNEDQKKAWLNELKQLVEEERIYADPELRLSGLAEKIGTNGRALSQLIKNEFGLNFNEYLNWFRTNEVIERLHSSDAQNLTIMALANEAGFKSNSAFYKAFKSQTGYTPVEFIRNKNNKIQ